MYANSVSFFLNWQFFLKLVVDIVWYLLIKMVQSVNIFRFVSKYTKIWRDYLILRLGFHEKWFCLLGSDRIELRQLDLYLRCCKIIKWKVTKGTSNKLSISKITKELVWKQGLVPQDVSCYYKYIYAYPFGNGLIMLVWKVSKIKL